MVKKQSFELLSSAALDFIRNARVKLSSGLE
jgi:hypothetical protein